MPTSIIFNNTPDYTGVNPAYLISSEQHVISKNQFRDFYFIVPQYSPFYAESVVIKYNDPTTQTIRNLVEGIDYYCTLPFVGATRAIGRPVYGAIGLNNLNVVGVISVTYQALGGQWSFDQNEILALLADMVYNPRTTTWEVITDLPNIFPPIPHEWNLQDLVGQTDIVNALNNIEAAIATQAQTAWTRHLSDYTNPHNVTKAQLGIPDIGNWPLATESEVIAGSVTDKLVTPATIAALLANYNNINIATILSNYYNKSDVNKQIFLAKPRNVTAASMFLTAR